MLTDRKESIERQRPFAKGRQKEEGIPSFCGTVTKVVGKKSTQKGKLGLEKEAGLFCFRKENQFSERRMS